MILTSKSDSLRSRVLGSDVMENPGQVRPAASRTVTDRFDGALPAGAVIGTVGTGGVKRLGVDAEGVLSIGDGGLRIGHPRHPGWGRTSLAYGPYHPHAGLAFAAFLLNGHNTSQTDELPDSLLQRLARPLVRSVLLKTGYDWLPRIAPKPPIPYHDPPIHENLAVGFFPEIAPNDPLTAGHGFVMHALGPECGELWVRTGSSNLRAIRSVQNVPIYYVVALRSEGAAYYVSSMKAASGMPGYPDMRPIGIDRTPVEDAVFAVITQSVLGESGFQIDSRLYGVQVSSVLQLGQWYGTAHVADRLTGDGDLHDAQCELGNRWNVAYGLFARTPRGAQAGSSAVLSVDRTGDVAASHLALVRAPAPSGLVRAVVDSGPGRTPIGLVWRGVNVHDFWCAQASTQNVRLFRVRSNVWSEVACDDRHALSDTMENDLQVIDDGVVFSLHLNGHLLFDRHFKDHTCSAGPYVGILAPSDAESPFVRSFEAHPRTVPIPPALDMGAPWEPEPGEVAIRDDFRAARSDLHGSITSYGGQTWRRELGHGRFRVEGGAAIVEADVDRPCPDRTAYTVPWHDDRFADLTVDITPPGTQRGQGHTGRGALLFVQDADTYVIVNNFFSDRYLGAAISSFFRIDGFEDVYNAVWTNVGDRILWGVPYRLRVVFDGLHYAAYINDEVVLYRALNDVFPGIEPLRIRRVGIAANWEFGTDTGSIFRHFVARGSPPSHDE